MENQFLDFPRTRDEKTFEHLLFIKIYIDLQNRVKATSAATRVDQFRKDVKNIVAFHVFIKVFFFSFFLGAYKRSRVFRVSHSESVFWWDSLVHDHLNTLSLFYLMSTVPAQGDARLDLVFLCCQMEARFAQSTSTEASSFCR